ncbi:hypothetical protein [Mycolicibacterium fortuitum]|uniref:Uncharacterized protein n=2 Tax=Mycolicibacterium fortuitum TaxID=1766 RepID=A0AAE4VJJ5_MYCFO|nr:hypothetical protein [Mycolicibacterium fortuitum]MCV7141666.1 hypothetical protein [Mycolicibacterium fortuitum]MDV7195620.1 hypothetical protein [Mycolicibacterium fortuitum]MDV7209269.1 hypothetical protein [Mycolicibacterium fortuitum]MDV7231144.1 hypothetical protein [Mycolicibacterium fortuitum]MDV7262715.1 hypothetical protein [Mycolicibacterium fortuitum]
MTPTNQHQGPGQAPVRSDQSAAGDGAVAMQTVLIKWTEISQHQARVQIPARADVDALDLENRLAELDNDGFQGLEREIVAVTAVEGDPNAEVLI